MANVYPGLVAHSADGEIETVMYQFLPAMLLNEYQKQAREVTQYKARILQLEKAVAEVAELREQTAHLARLVKQQRDVDTVRAALAPK